jgi:hypothetical protein
VLALVATVVIGCGAVVAWALTRPGPTGPVTSRTGDLLEEVTALVDAMPKQNSDGYVVPTSSQIGTMQDAFRDIVGGDLSHAAGAVGPLGYQVVRFTDSVTGRKLVMLEEGSPGGVDGHAWGLYVVAPSSTSALLVEAAHPFDDVDSYFVAVDTFRLADARALFVSGASRFAAPDGQSDAAHARRTVFEGLNEVVAGPGRVVFEPHGFETDRHPNYGDMVVSNGQIPPDAFDESVAAGLREAGFKVCVYDGLRCAALGGTTNVQGQAARVAGAYFLHIEMDPRIRASETMRRTLAQVLAGAVGAYDFRKPPTG